MRDVGASGDHGDRPRSGRGVESHVRSLSPQDPHRSPGHRSSRHRQPHPRLGSGSDDHRYPSRDRSRGRHDYHFSQYSRRSPETEDLIPRYRAGLARHRDPDEKQSRSSHSRHQRSPRSRSRSPPSAKRHRGRSHSVDFNDRKRSKTDHSVPRRKQLGSPDPDLGHHRRRLSPYRRSDSSPRHRPPQHSHRPPSQAGDGARYHYHRRSPSRSPPGYDASSRHPPFREARHPRPAISRPPPLSRSPSPDLGRRPDSSRHPVAPSRNYRNHRSPISIAPERPGPDSHPDSDRWASSRQPPTRSPKPHHHRDRPRRDDSPEPCPSSRSELEDDMASRSSMRGPHAAAYTHKPHYTSEPAYAHQSPPHGGSYQTSPSMSPYGSHHRGPWTGKYPSQHSYPSQHHHGHGAYDPPHGGPQESFPPYPPHSPSYTAPSGPMQQHSQGNVRGPYRGGSGSGGGSGSFRGAPYAGRGANRASSTLHGGQRRPSNPETSPQGQRNWPSEEGKGRRNSAGRGVSDTDEVPGEPMLIDDNSSALESRATKAASGGMTGSTEEAAASESGPISFPAAENKPPQSQAGGSNKFSFSFKSTARPTPTAPRPEISQKFNAPPSRREPRRKDESEGDLPRGAPTEPASDRPGFAFRAAAAAAPEMAQKGPRTRTVRKTMRRLKARPTLPADLVASESVFYRKPGNESVVGSGTYGKVFKGLNVYTKGLVALKRIRMEGERDGFPVTAVREIKLLQSLRHTNIVNLQEVMVEKNDCFMVFEYLSHDLTGLLNHPSFQLDAAQRKDLAKQLFQGLDYLHSRGVLHRDIKAANILVSNEGVLKLADFGLARFYAKRHQLDYTNRVITIWYRPPELLLGETKYTAAVDVWSAACVMVEIFTRHAIFAGDGTELSQLDKIYDVLGTPNRQDWPGLVDMAWFELLRPTVKRRSTFADKFREKLTPAAFDLLSAMFCYDPAKRPTAAEALRHVYFLTEEPLPRQAVELASIDGDWHEFEFKALRKENERREREARKVAKDGPRDRERKRGSDSQEGERETKRVQGGGRAA